jgi:hypothetical protein
MSLRMYFLGGTILPTRFMENMYCAIFIVMIGGYRGLTKFIAPLYTQKTRLKSNRLELIWVESIKCGLTIVRRIS